MFVDIGANKGIFIDKLNDINSSASVLAFEPNPHLKETLNKKIKNGTLIQAALSNELGSTTFNIYTADGTTSSLFDRDDMMPHFTKQVDRIDVVLEKLDNFSNLIVSNSGGNGVFIKIDAEGAELAVMEGSSATMDELPKAFLMFEYSKAWKSGNHSLRSAFHLLDEMSYKLFRVTPLGLEALRFYTPDMDGSDYCNYLAVKGFEFDVEWETAPIRSATHNWNQFHIFP